MGATRCTGLQGAATDIRTGPGPDDASLAREARGIASLNLTDECPSTEVRVGAPEWNLASGAARAQPVRVRGLRMVLGRRPSVPPPARVERVDRAPYRPREAGIRFGSAALAIPA